MMIKSKLFSFLIQKTYQHQMQNKKPSQPIGKSLEPTLQRINEPQIQQGQQNLPKASINGDNFFQRYFFTWPYSLIKLNQNNNIKINQLPALPSQFMAGNLFQDYKKNIKQFEEMGLLKMLLKVFGCEFLKLVVLCVFTELFYLSYPILIYYNIDYLQDHRDNLNYGIILFAVTIVVSFLYNLVYTNLKYLFKLLGVNVSTHLNLLIFNKSLKYSLHGNKMYDESSIISLSQTDIDNMMYIGSKLAFFIFGFIQLFAGFGLMYWFVGFSFVAGLIVLVIITLVTLAISSCNVHLAEEVLEKKDERLSATEQLLNIIRFIKQNAYQKLYFKKIKTWREKQLQIYKKKGTIETITVFLYYLTAPLILTAVILTYLYIHQEMSPASVFTTMMIAVVFEVTSQQFPKAISQIISIFSSIKRIEQFLAVKEIKQQGYFQSENTIETNKSIVIGDGGFYINNLTLKQIKEKQSNKNIGKARNKQRKDTIISIDNNINRQHKEFANTQKELGEPQNDNKILMEKIVIMKKINIQIQKGKLYMIFGNTGSGKSSLLRFILNQYNLDDNTSIQINGKISYVRQRPWIFSGSVKSNIEFIHEKSQKRLIEAIRYSCLEDDIKLFANGINTQIGQNGINLSGGQKVRVDLARSLYSNKDIYLFDDLLSAVDIHVASYIMENTIKQYLKEKTILITTHAIKFAKLADYIIFIDSDRSLICESFEGMMKNQKFQKFLERAQQQETQKLTTKKSSIMELQIIKAVIEQSQMHEEPIQPNTAAAALQQQKQIETLILSQDQQKGEVDFKIFKEYIKLNGGYACFLLPIIGCLIIYSAIQTAASILISMWSDSNGQNRYLLYIYIGLTLSANVFIFLQALILTFTGVKQGESVHNNIVKGLIYADLNKFFHRVPLGRIVNRLSHDLKEMDEVISNTFCSSITTACKILSAIVISIYTSTPFTLIPVAIVVVFFVKIRGAYIASQNQLIRLEKTTNSPLVVGFTNGIKGAEVIRSYQCQDRFIKDYIQGVNNYKRVLYNRYGLTSWFILVLVYLTYLINMFSIGFCMFGPNINPSQIGLLLTYILNFNDELFQFVLDQTEFQTQLISLERLYQLMNLPPQEKYTKYCETWTEEEEKIGDVFESGSIEFQNVSVRYRPDLPRVISNLNVVIQSGEKVGVIGRTGSGKSTIMNTLLEITSVSEGNIVIGRKDLSEISLKELRKSITVIDQDSVLLNSTFRENLDIFGQCTEQQLKSAIRQCNIQAIIAARGGLDEKIDGNSLSAGEKQLICICRAVLKRNKIVLIDQATANIDVKNDALIQKVMSQKFRDKTVLMIAHRLSSLQNYDKIMVMEGGRLIEYGSPSDLLVKKGIYYLMMEKYNSMTQ